MKIIFDGLHGSSKTSIIKGLERDGELIWPGLKDIIPKAKVVDLDQYKDLPPGFAGEVERLNRCYAAFNRCNDMHIYLLDRGPFSPLLYSIAMAEVEDPKNPGHKALEHLDVILNTYKTHPIDLTNTRFVILDPPITWIKRNMQIRGKEAHDIMWDEDFLECLWSHYVQFYTQLSYIAHVLWWSPQNKTPFELAQKLQELNWIWREDVILEAQILDSREETA